MEYYHISIRFRRAFIELPYVIQCFRIIGVNLMGLIIIILSLLHGPCYHIGSCSIDVKAGNIGIVLNCLCKVINSLIVTFSVVATNTPTVVGIAKSVADYWGYFACFVKGIKIVLQSLLIIPKSTIAIPLIDNHTWILLIEIQRLTEQLQGLVILATLEKILPHLVIGQGNLVLNLVLEAILLHLLGGKFQILEGRVEVHPFPLDEGSFD